MAMKSPLRRGWWTLVGVVVFAACGSWAGTKAEGAGPRVLEEGALPPDARLRPLKDLDGYFPFGVPGTKEAWESRAQFVRRRILVSQGLWPEPTRTPLNAVVHGRVEREGYTIEKVYFESRPGFFVTGNLYRPANVKGKVPGVLFAHGHWADARLSEAGDAELRRELAEGEERFEEGGRSRFQSMCVQLARMGCVVWQWDMLGNSDSQQVSMALAHGFGKQRPEMNAVSDWGLFSPQAEAHLQSVMGLQTWNAVRSLDFLLTLPEVDATRVAMTGASGGGTQTMLLAAIDPRVALSFPAVMVSTAMQGGCTCENASLLRVGTGNVEFAGLFAPKPQGMTSANDWTKEMASKGFPELQRLYGMLGAPGNVMLKRGEHFPHNYNAVSRSAFYTWLNRHFGLGQREPVIERDYRLASRAELSVWDDAHPAPKAADPAFERALLRQWHEDDQRLLGAAASDAARMREVHGKGWEVVLDGASIEGGAVAWDLKDKRDRGGWTEMSGMLRDAGRGAALPVAFAHPKEWNGRTTVWLTGSGKSGLYADGGELKAAVRTLVEGGTTVIGVDLLHQGEFLPDGKPLAGTPKVKNPREAWAYTFGYNPSVFVERVHDVLGVLRFVRDHEKQSSRIDMVALEGAGPVAAAARAMASGVVGRAAIDTDGFRFGKLLDLRHPDFTPGGAKYGDMDGLIALGAPGATLLLGEKAVPTLAARMYTGAATGAIRASAAAGSEGKALEAAGFVGGK